MAKVIMTVDDSASIRKLIVHTLKQEGYEILEAVDGVDALAKLDEKQVDLVLTDVNMPNMDGIELVRNVRKNPGFRFLPIILITTESEVEKNKKEGKPVRPAG